MDAVLAKFTGQLFRPHASIISFGFHYSVWQIFTAPLGPDTTNLNMDVLMVDHLGVLHYLYVVLLDRPNVYVHYVFCERTLG